MAHVGQGTTHKGQLDELDAEIAAMEAEVRGDSQQPEATPEQVAAGQQPPVQEQGEQQPQQQQFEEVITSVDEFEAAEAGVQPGSQEEAHEVTPTEQPPVQPEPAVEPQPTGRRSWKSDYLELENRYKLLRQSSDHHKFETKQQIAGLQEALLRSQEDVEKLKAYLAEQAAGRQQSITDVFSQEDIDVLGEGTVTSVQKAINQAVGAATQPLQSELLAMKKAERDRLRQAAEVNRSQAYDSFTGRLQQLVPDYAGINVDQNFIKWLKQPSPYSGVARMTHFHQAEQAGDVERVAQFFVEYKQMMNAGQQHLEQSVTPTGQGGGGAAPRTNIPPQQNPGEKIFSMAFINQFYDDDIAGKYKGREALRDKLDAEIDLALQQGRVR